MPAPDTIRELVEKFTANRDRYKSATYNETQARVEFINPFFHALGWDVTNSRQVIHETRVYVDENGQSRPKYPDYAFLKSQRADDIGFFVEAKAPHVDVRGGISPAYQVRRYGWSANLPASVLTDFEEFSVYDCRVRPNRDDRPQENRLRYYTYTDYVDRWDEIAAIFSYDAVRSNKLDDWVRGEKARGVETVDAAFLNEMERWRMMLAKDIALHNPALSRRELNMAVQTTIDRIVFLRICEDREIEPYGRLRDLGKASGIYRNLAQLFRQADSKYNSGLFHFPPASRDRAGEPDTITLSLHIDDAPLSAILTNLYYPVSPYEFSVLPADILGQVYERFLGKVIELSPGGVADVVEKPEVRKAGGVYYTPTYIVDYIVQNTVGKLTSPPAPLQTGEGSSISPPKGEGACTPDDVAKLRILDPACGSGSFLIGAYQFLMDWHLDYYTHNKPEQWVKKGVLRDLTLNPSPLGRGTLSPHAADSPLQVGEGPGVRSEARPGGEVVRFALTTATKKRILLNTLYGVDLDQSAVEVTKLSLLLKMLEGETATTTQPSLLVTEHVLPDLSGNIKWGNSLIGSDFYDGETLSMFGDEDLNRVKVFDWHSRTRGFGAIMENGGFDAVIGNPPYVRSQTLGGEQRDYFNHHYSVATGTYDIYVLFVEKAISIINSRGRIGLILPNKFFTTDYGEGLRRLLAQGSTKYVDRIIDFQDAQVFSQAGTYTALLFLSCNGSLHPSYVGLGNVYREFGSLGLAKTLSTSQLNFESLILTVDGERWTLATGTSSELLLRLQREFGTFETLEPHIFQGLKTSADKVYLVTLQNQLENGLCTAINGLGDEVILEYSILKPVVKGEHVKRYSVDTSANLHVIYPYVEEPKGKAKLISAEQLANEYPHTWAYLNKHFDTLGARDKDKWRTRNDWYAYARSQNIVTFLGKKILMPYMTTNLRVAIDITGELFLVNITTGGYGVRFSAEPQHDYFVVGLLNSTLLDWCIQHLTNRFRGGYFAMNKQALERLPIRTIDFTAPADAARHDRMVALVERMLDLHKQLPAASGQAKSILQAQVETTDREIDALVYELYGLTEDEIRIVEGRT